jgi:hypothetical protein
MKPAAKPVKKANRPSGKKLEKKVPLHHFKALKTI